MKRNKKIKVLYFANIPIVNQERSIGGATVLAKSILEFILKDNRISVKHSQIRFFWRNKLQLIDYFIWLFRFPFSIWNKEVVSFHGTKDFHFTIAPILWLWSKLLGKKIVYHVFGGNFHEQYQKLSKIQKIIINKTILKSDTVFFETIQMIDFFKVKNIKNIVWLPNSRKPSIKELAPKKFHKKFVFISRVIPEKGIIEIIKAANQLPKGYCIDVYGPIDDRHYKADFFDTKKVTYKGLLNPNQVINKLSNYDVLMLPSYFEGEGYPGIIIESLALGIPVITTKWKALPEIITTNVNGILIDIKNEEELENAIIAFNEENYPTFRKNAFKSFQQFSSDVVFNKIINSYLK
jgi:glycosyltransferase involved in cell wall biosynthesis|tara:strand:+ start:213 stop:1262 length:1050 start_codon:yes stop_codon:yes gene_type:complete